MDVAMRHIWNRNDENHQDALVGLLNSSTDIRIICPYNLAAKPIIDIDVVISGYSVFPQVTEKLEGIGYFHNGNWGIEEREVFDKRKEVVWQPPLTIAHNLYICPQEGLEWQRHIAFRNQLRQNASYRKEYEEIKRDIARRGNDDRKKYVEVKARECRSFVERVLADT